LLDGYKDGGLYEACMLLLFNPWRDIWGLKNGHESFGRAFIEFEQVMTLSKNENSRVCMATVAWKSRLTETWLKTIYLHLPDWNSTAHSYASVIWKSSAV
jgi:hypothetical protein